MQQRYFFCLTLSLATCQSALITLHLRYIKFFANHSPSSQKGSRVKGPPMCSIIIFSLFSALVQLSAANLMDLSTKSALSICSSTHAETVF